VLGPTLNISEYDVVRVIATIPPDRVDRSVSDDRVPQIGDIGAVVFVLATASSRGPAYIVECIGSDGHTLWLADMFASELERVSSGAGGA